mgnify:CR=1 FL=1
MPARLPGKRVLVVEDNPALAYDIDDSLREVGAHVVGPALDLATGLKLARENHLDAAVLDIDLGRDFVWPLAHQLKGHDIPFVFVSAECGDKLPEDFRNVVCLDKPAPTRKILETVSEALASAKGD